MSAPLVNDGPFNGVPLLERLQDWQDDRAAQAFVPNMLADMAEAATEIKRLRGLLLAPLSSEELKLVDKNSNWVAFKHSWSAIVKHRLAVQPSEGGK